MKNTVSLNVIMEQFNLWQQQEAELHFGGGFLAGARAMRHLLMEKNLTADEALAICQDHKFIELFAHDQTNLSDL